MSLPELKKSLILDFYKDALVICLTINNISGIHLLGDCNVNDKIFNNNCRISTTNGYIVEILNNETEFTYRLVYENTKINNNNIISQNSDLEKFKEVSKFLNYVVKG